jgi:cyanophycin synthetase
MQENIGKENIIQDTCPYCGDSPINHRFAYISNYLSLIVEPYFNFLSKKTPRFLKVIGDRVFSSLFVGMRLMRIASYSTDIEKAVTLRSKIIWEEGRKRGMNIEQIVVYGKPTEHFRIKGGGKTAYYDSLPIPSKYFFTGENWDDKIYLKNKFKKEGIPVPEYHEVSLFSDKKLGFFDGLNKPIIVKPRVGSRGRHTTTNIHTREELREAIDLGKKICPILVVEENLFGYICRATLVDGKIAGFYRAEAPHIIGDGVKTITELILDKDEKREERVQKVNTSPEFHDFLRRSGFTINDVLPAGKTLFLTHRTGRYFGGKTKEMLPELHPSFIPILEKAAALTALPVAGFDCIIPDPEKPADSQKWGIIECNTLPFIDLHYFALEGTPSKNIAGMLWDLWDKETK